MMKKEQIVNIFDLMQTAFDKREELSNAIEKFTGDYAYVPAMQNEVEKVINILWMEAFNDMPNEQCINDMTWLEWHIYENDFGKKQMRAFLPGKEYKICSNEDMADFLIDWMSLRSDQNSKEEKDVPDNGDNNDTNSNELKDLLDKFGGVDKFEKAAKSLNNIIDTLSSVSEGGVDSIYEKAKSVYDVIINAGNNTSEKCIFDATKLFTFCKSANFDQSSLCKNPIICADDRVAYCKTVSGGRGVIVVTNCINESYMQEIMSNYNNATTRICILVTDCPNNKSSIQRFFDNVITEKMTYDSKDEYDKNIKRICKLVNCW